MNFCSQISLLAGRCWCLCRFCAVQVLVWVADQPQGLYTGKLADTTVDTQAMYARVFEQPYMLGQSARRQAEGEQRDDQRCETQRNAA